MYELITLFFVVLHFKFNFSSKEIIPVTLKNEKEVLIKEIIEYLYEDEKKNFEESEKPNNHIFCKIERLKTLID